MRTVRVGRILAAVVAGLAVAGCGGGDDSPPEGATPAAPAGTGPEVIASLTDYAITLSEPTLAPGSYTFVAVQEGGDEHALTISGPGVDDATTPTIQAGGSEQRLTVTLQAGSYELWCPVEDHRQVGMETTVTVQ